MPASAGTSLVVLAAVPAQGAAWPFLVEFLDEHWQEVVLALFAFAGILRLYAWSQLQEYNTFDMIMRGIPVEDLSSAGQMAWLASWLLSLVACVIGTIKYVAPLLDR